MNERRDRRPVDPRSELRAEALEKRLLMSATWVDPETGEPIPAPTEEADEFQGSEDDDVADGGGGDDTLHGAGGGDQLGGGAGNDALHGGDGDDLLHGGSGDDLLHGDAGHDLVDYRDAQGGVAIDITAIGVPQDTGGAGVDTVWAVEGILGSAHDDVFAFGSPLAGATYTVDGGGGVDTIDLSAFDRADVSVDWDDGVATIDLGGGQTARIEFSGVTRMLFADQGANVAASGPALVERDVEEGTATRLVPALEGGDPAGLTFTWRQVGGAPVVLDDPQATTPGFVIPEGFTATSLSFEVEISDGVDTWTQTLFLAVSGDNDAVRIDAADVTVAERSLVQLAATFVEPEGQEFLFGWRQVSGPPVVLDDAGSATPSFVAPELLATTAIVFEVTATDGTTTSSRLVTVTVQAANDAPSASAGPDRTVVEDTRTSDALGNETVVQTVVTLEGSAHDPEGQGLTYSWRQVSGPAVTLDDPHAARPSFTAPQGVANYDLRFELTVSDGVNVTSDTVTITVATDDDRPTVDSVTAGIGGDEGAPIPIAATATDPEGRPLTFTWSQVAGPTVSIADPHAAATSFTSPELLANTWITLQVEVSDGETTSSRLLDVLVNADNDAPTVDVGPDRDVRPGGRVEIFAGAQDPEGRPLAYVWTQTAGPTVAIHGQGTHWPTFVAPSVGEPTPITMQVGVFDGRTWVYDSVTIVVDAASPNEHSGAPNAGGGGGGSPNQPTPIVVAVPTLVTTQEVTPTTLAVDDSGHQGGALSYTWRQTAGVPVDLRDADQRTAAFDAPELVDSQVLRFEVEITDGTHTRTEVVQVVVQADNDAQSADAGAAQTVHEDEVVTLAATTTDPEGQRVVGRWEQVSGPAVALSDPTDPNARFVAPNLHATADVVLRWVSDDGANVVHDEVTITILADEDAATVDAGPPAQVPEGATFRMNPSVADPEGEAVTYTWTQVSGPAVTLSDPHAERPTFVAPELHANQDVVFRLEVFDGHTTVADTVTITIVADDDPPVIDAGPYQEVAEGDLVQLTGTATDRENDAVQWRWVQIGGPAVTLSDPHAPTPTFTAPEGLVNSYLRFRLEVSDATSTVTDEVTILVHADNDAPVNDAGADRTVAERSVVTLAGTAHDPEGQPMSHRWVQVSGPPVTLSSTTALNPTFTAPDVLASEPIVFELRSSDGTHTTVDTVTITVAGVNDGPVALAGAAAGTEDQPVTLRLAGEDPDYSDAVESVRIETVPANGTLQWNGVPVTAGTVIPIADVDAGSLRFVPDANWSGTTAFEFRVSDGDAWSTAAATQSIRIAGVADNPDFVAGPAAGAEDTPIPIPVAVTPSDADGSEVVEWTRVVSAPRGAVFSDGNVSLTYTGSQLNLAGMDLANLTVTPPRDLDQDFEVRFRTRILEPDSGSRFTDNVSVIVDVTPVQDAPYAETATANTTEDTTVPVVLRGRDVDTGDVIEAFRVETLPDPAAGYLEWNGAPVTAGTVIPAAEIAAGALRFVPATHDHGAGTFTFRVFDGEDWSVAAATATVNVTAVADAPTLGVPATVATLEDTAVAVPVAVGLVDTDGSESVSQVRVEGLPPGATLSDGVHSFVAGAGATSADVTTWNLAALTVRPPLHDADDFTLTIRATSREASNGATAESTATVDVQVTAVADAPTLPASSASGDEDSAIDLGLGVVFADLDASEDFALTLGGLLPGATVSDGTHVFTAAPGADSVDVGDWDLAQVRLTPPADSDVDFQLTVTATATERSNLDVRSANGTIDVSVAAVADAPALSVSAARGAEDAAIPLTIATGLTDTDGSESLRLTVAGIPVGAVLSDGVETFTATGGATAVDVTGWDLATLTITPPADSGDDFTLTVTATATEAANASAAATIRSLPVTVDAVADAPTLATTDGSGLEDLPIAFGVVTGLTDLDGSETLVVTVRDVPVGATIGDGHYTFTATAGTTTVDVSAWDLAALTVTPPSHSDADFTLTIRATAIEGENADAAFVESTATIQVAAAADAPTIVVARTVGAEDTAIAMPVHVGLPDADGSESLAVAISGVPVGVTLSDGTRSFTGAAGDDRVDVTGWDLGALTVTPVADADADFTLRVTAVTTEAANASQATTVLDVPVEVVAVADAPTLATTGGSGDEDTAIGFGFTSALTDSDGSETLSVELSTIPVGATVTDGVHSFTATAGSTSVDVTGWDWTSLTVTPPADSDQDFSLTVTSTSRESANGDVATTVGSIAIGVAAVADAPTLSVTASAGGDEDTAIPLVIVTNLSDADASERLGVVIENVPVGATLTDGVNTWTATPGNTTGDVSGWDLSALTVTPPDDLDSDFTLRITATATETANGNAVSTSADITVGVTAVADAPALSTTGGSGSEDTAIGFGFTSALTDSDGSETLSVELSTIPVGATVTDGVRSFTATVGSTSVDVSGWDWTSLTVTPPADSDQDFSLTVTSTSRESANGDVATTVGSIAIGVAAVADAPTLSVTASAGGDEDTAIPLVIVTNLSDSDASEQLGVVIENVPVGARLTDGVNTWTATPGDTTGDVSGWDLSALTVTPPDDLDSDFTLRITATATETANGNAVSTSADITVGVTAVADAPGLTVTAGSGDEDTAIPFGVATTLTDADGSETLTVELSAIPVGATVSDGVHSFTATSGDTAVDVSGWNRAALTVTPPPDLDHDFDLTITATSREASNGDVATTVDTVTIGVTASADAPTLSTTGGSGSEDTAIGFGFTSALTDSDGSETLSVELSTIPVGATVTDGVHSFTATAGSTSADVTGWDWTSLTVTPPADSDQDFSLTVTSTSRESANGHVATTVGSIAIGVAAVADAPTLSVTASAGGDEDTAIPLVIVTNLSDADASEQLGVVIENVPPGATLSDGVNTWTATPGNTTGDVSGWDLSALTVTPPDDLDSDFTLRITATATETANGNAISTSADITVTVAAVADAPSIAVTAGSGSEDTAIGFGFTSALTDGDGSETLSVELSTIPVGATVTDGVHSFTATVGSTSVDVTGWDWTSLTVTPPADSDQDFSLTVTSTSRETANGDIATTVGSIAIGVSAVADAPTLSITASAGGDEDTAIPLVIVTNLSDADASEQLGVVIENVPPGATLSDGVNTWTATPGDTTGDVSGWDLSALTVTPPDDLDSDFTLRITATATETANGNAVSTSADITVGVTAVADAPTLSTTGGSGSEDTAIGFGFTSALTDSDGSETLSVELSTIPVGATVTDGVNSFTATAGSTSVDVTGWDWTSLTVTPPADSDQDFSLTVTSTSRESANGDVATTVGSIAIGVAAVADAPALSVTASAGGDEDTAIPLVIVTNLSDSDASEQLGVVIENVPPGATLSDGVNTWTATPGNTTGDVSGWDLSALTVTPPDDLDSDFTLRITATATETANGNAVSTSADITVGVTAVADAPALSTTGGSGSEDTAIGFGFTSALTDSDGSETLSVELSTIPVGATVTDGVHSFTATAGSTSVDVTGWDWTSLTVTPPADSDQDFSLTVTSTSRETANGDIATTVGSIAIGVSAVADAPTLSITASAGGDEDTAIPLVIVTNLSDADASEQLGVVIENVPPGATLSDGVNTWTATPGDTTGDVSGWDLSALTVTPPDDLDSDFTLRITATATETANGNAVSTSADITVGIRAVADAPSVTVTAGSGDEDTAIAFGIDAALRDVDGSETLIVTISDIPVGAVLTDGTHVFTGTPGVDGVDVTGWDWTSLTVTPPADQGEDFELRIRATSREATGDTAETLATIPIDVRPVADAPVIDVADTAGVEDGAIPFVFVTALRGSDADESERLHLEIGGLPAGAVLTDGVRSQTATHDGAVADLTGWDLANLRMVPPPDFSGTIALTVSAISVEPDGGDRAVTSQGVTIDVRGVADAPTLRVDAAAGDEDTSIGLALTAAGVDADDSEMLFVAVSGLPAGAVLDDGVHRYVATGTEVAVDISGWDFAALRVTPPTDSSVDFTLRITATSVEPDSGDRAVTVAEIPVEVRGVADEIRFEAPASLRAYSTDFVPFELSMATRDAVETWTVVVRGLPDGAELSAGARQPDGSWVVPADQLDGLALRAPSGPTLDVTVTFRADDEGHVRESTHVVRVQRLDQAPLEDPLPPRTAIDPATGLPVGAVRHDGGPGDPDIPAFPGGWLPAAAADTAGGALGDDGAPDRFGVTDVGFSRARLVDAEARSYEDQSSERRVRADADEVVELELDESMDPAVPASSEAAPPASTDGGDAPTPQSAQPPADPAREPADTPPQRTASHDGDAAAATEPEATSLWSRMTGAVRRLFLG